MAFACVCLSLWGRGFAKLGIVTLGFVLAVGLPLGAVVGLTVLGVVVSPAIPFGVSGLGAIAFAGLFVYLALSGELSHPGPATHLRKTARRVGP